MDVKEKIVHVKMIDGTRGAIEALQHALSTINPNNEYKFLITNDKIELTDIKYLIKTLVDLYKKIKKDDKSGK